MTDRHQRARGMFRAAPNRRGSAYWRIGVPREIAVLVEGTQFTCELTEEGILYRPTAPASPSPGGGLVVDSIDAALAEPSGE